MVDVKLDEIPNLVKKNELSYQQACIQVYKIIYTQPARFNLFDMDEDVRSDFLLEFLQKKLHGILQNFDSQTAPFGAYVFYSLQLAKLSFLKKVKFQKEAKRIFMQDNFLQYEEQMQNTADSVMKVSEEDPKYVVKPEKDEIPQLAFKALYKKIPHRLALADSTQRRLKQGVLILALKSAWYINDSEINRVSSICKISSKVLTELVCKIKSNLISKALCRKSVEDYRGKAFFLMSKYKSQIKSMEDKSKEVVEQIQKKLDYQTKVFFTKDSMLKGGRFRICPTNSEVAKLIGISTKAVSNYLMRIKTIDFSNFDYEKYVGV